MQQDRQRAGLGSPASLPLWDALGQGAAVASLRGSWGENDWFPARVKDVVTDSASPVARLHPGELRLLCRGCHLVCALVASAEVLPRWGKPVLMMAEIRGCNGCLSSSKQGGRDPGRHPLRDQMGRPVSGTGGK